LHLPVGTLPETGVNAPMFLTILMWKHQLQVRGDPPKTKLKMPVAIEI